MRNLGQLVDDPEFKDRLREAIMQLPESEFDLQQALKLGSVALPETLEIMIMQRRDDDTEIRFHSGLFFESMIAGCNCADDPTPADTLQEYCEADISISRETGIIQIQLSEPSE